jgi:RNA polymerase sigma-70 factor, ECF subfamily
MADGPDAGLALLERLAASGALAGYRLLPAARADLARRAGRFAAAAEWYREAITLATSDDDHRLLRRRLVEVERADAHDR